MAGCMGTKEKYPLAVQIQASIFKFSDFKLLYIILSPYM